MERVWATFREDEAAGAFSILRIEEEHLQAATPLLDRVETPLRTLDAIHLSLAESAGSRHCATADHIFAAGARELGFEVATFFLP